MIHQLQLLMARNEQKYKLILPVLIEILSFVQFLEWTVCREIRQVLDMGKNTITFGNGTTFEMESQ